MNVTIPANIESAVTKTNSYQILGNQILDKRASAGVNFWMDRILVDSWRPVSSSGSRATNLLLAAVCVASMVDAVLSYSSEKDRKTILGGLMNSFSKNASLEEWVWVWCNMKNIPIWNMARPNVSRKSLLYVKEFISQYFEKCEKRKEA